MKNDVGAILVRVAENNTVQVSGLNSNQREALARRIRKMNRGCESQLIIEYATDGMLYMKTGLGMELKGRIEMTKSLATLIEEQVEAPTWR